MLSPDISPQNLGFDACFPTRLATEPRWRKVEFDPSAAPLGSERICLQTVQLGAAQSIWKGDSVGSGTSGSNPLSSTGESANSRSLAGDDMRRRSAKHSPLTGS